MTDSNTAVMMPPMQAAQSHVSIAVVGTEGAGKTVLMTVLARRYRSADEQGLYLEPQDGRTLKYVEKVWAILNDYDWPPSTAPGELFDLQWKLICQKDELTCDFRLVDSAGQDLRRLFGGDEVAKLDELPEHLQSLQRYCRDADIIIYLVNLKDFTGERSKQRCIENESAIKSAMDYISHAHSFQKHMCLVFTQIDQHGWIEKQLGGWRNVAKAYMPYVVSAHINSSDIAVLGLSAVNQTRLLVHPDYPDIPRRVPERDFGSEGFDDLMTWLATAAKNVIADKERARTEQRRTQEQAIQAQAGAVQAQLMRRKAKQGYLVLMVAIILVVCIFLWNRHQENEQQRIIQIDGLVRGGLKANIETKPLRHDNVWITNGSSIAMTNVKVDVYIYQDGRLVDNAHLAESIIGPSKTKTWESVLWVSGNYFGSGTSITISCDQLQRPMVFKCE